jgi:small neutral amino acid transporter SnatA (MarC family)
MKLQRILEGSAIVMGLGVALLFASPARAQQEMNPDTFDINPGTPTEVAAATPVSAPTTVQDGAMVQAAIMPASNWDGSFAAPWNAVDLTMVVILAAGTVLVTLFALAATRRQRRQISSVRSSDYAQSSGATTH